MGLKYRVFHWGTQADAVVMTARAAELLALMPAKAPPDLSRFLLSPMPGLLTEVAVKVGQEVRGGENGVGALVACGDVVGFPVATGVAGGRRPASCPAWSGRTEAAGEGTKAWAWATGGTLLVTLASPGSTL